MNARRILGIDPGLAESGWGIVEKNGSRLRPAAFGVISTSPHEGHAQRLLAIYREITGIIEEWQPAAGAVEKLYFAKNAKTAMPVGEARGVLCLALAGADIPVFEYSPNEIKQTVTGVGTAEKQQVQEMVRLLLGLESIPRPDHAADALAAAITHSHLGGFSARS